MSGLIPKQFINDLISRADIVEIIDTHVPLRKAGKNYTACCPFHDEKTPSFSVSPQKQFFHCFGCGKSGNVLSFLIDYERLDFVDAVERLAARLGVEVPREATSRKNQPNYHDLYHLLSDVALHYQKQLPSNSKAMQYLKERGLSDQIIERYQIGYAPSAWENLSTFYTTPSKALDDLCIAGMLIENDRGGHYARFRHRILFPIHDRQGRVIGFGGRLMPGDEGPKYLNSPETPVFHKGQELYGLYQAIHHQQHPLPHAVIVEGYMDLLTLVQYGITGGVATLGTATTKQHLERLLRYTNTLIFCFDGDAAGKKAAWRALEVALTVMADGYQSKFMFLPDGEDPDSFLRKYGVEAFQQLLTNAIPLEQFFFSQMCTQIDISNLAGRAQLVQRANPLLEQIPPGFFQTMMRDELAKLGRIDRTSLAPMPTKAILKPSQAKTVHRLPPLRLAIVLLLQYPELVKHIETTEALASLTLPGMPLFLEMISLIKQQPGITTAGLLEHARGQPHADYLHKLMSWEHLLPQQDSEHEFIGTIVRLNDMAKEHVIEQLLNKAHLKNLTQEEKLQLQRLISESKQPS